MGVSEVTAELAESIAKHQAPLSAREAYLVFILRGMPLFLDINRLDLYDQAYWEVCPDEDETPTESLIDAVFWLGANSCYGAYNVTLTHDHYENTVAPLFRTAGIPLPSSPDLSRW